MLGQFLEVALVTADTTDAWQRLQHLGFEPASTGDVWPHAYGVVTCERLAIGLHSHGEEPLRVVFVRPDVAALHRELTARGIDIERARLGSDVFNELTLREPGGVALAVLEARSFSPPSRVPARTWLGRFVALSLPCSDLEDARAFWQQLGHEAEAVESPWEGFSLAGMPIACHPRRVLAEPVLVFREATLTDDALAGAGLAPQRPTPSLRDVPHRLLRAPGADLALLLLP